MVDNSAKKEYLSKIAERLKWAMTKKSINQTKLISLAMNAGYDMKQSTLSKMLSGSSSNMGILNIIQAATILHIDLNSLFSFDDSVEVAFRNEHTSESLEESPFICRADDMHMRAYLKNYHTYFFPTLSSDERILKGDLAFFPSEDRSKCLASFKFKTGKYNTQNQEIEKKYEGELILSDVMRAGYCTLRSNDIGEISYLLFSYFPIVYETLKCRVALVLTSSAGANRMPTAQRMLICEDELSTDDLEILQGQLFLNESEILISEVGLDRFMEDKYLDESFKEYFCKPEQNVKFAGLSPIPYYRFDESVIRDAFLDTNVKVNAISLIRRYSASPKYNKIGSRCDELVYKFICQKEREQDKLSTIE